MTTVTVQELAKLGKTMRDAQNDYFAARTRSALALAKNLEGKFDRIVLQILGEQATQAPLLEVGDAAPTRM